MNDHQRKDVSIEIYCSNHNKGKETKNKEVFVQQMIIRIEAFFLCYGLWKSNIANPLAVEQRELISGLPTTENPDYKWLS